MKVGDLVMRAYAWHAYVPGIIVDEETETVQFDDTEEYYTNTHYIVQWSDGTQTSEMDCELEHLEKVMAVLSKNEIKGLDDYCS